MKKDGLLIFAVLFLSILSSLTFVAASSTTCDPSISLLNQDPYPAVPGEYVKLVFKVDGLNNIVCKDLTFKLSEEYPITLDPGVDNSYVVSSGSYVADYSSSVLIPFKVRVDENALDGDNQIKLIYYNNKDGNPALVVKDFNLNVKNVNAAFEISVKDYDSVKQILTFDIINIGKNDVAALAVDIPQQASFDTKGSVRTILGSLNSGDDTSFTFEGVPKNGNINLKISYNDLQNVRRTMEQSVSFDSALFQNRVKDQTPSKAGYYIVFLIIIAGIGYWIYANNKKKKKLAKAQLEALRRK
ncbi:MAG: hypothetical protein WCK29_00530 [archaeon]